MPTIDIMGVPHSYKSTSTSSKYSAPVLVFLHGWLLSQHYWQPLLEQISGEYQCLVYDLRGFGDTKIPHQSNSQPESLSCDYTLAAYANDLKYLLQELDIRKAWLIGHSLGGSIALWAANYAKERVEGVICLNSGGGIYLKEEFERFRQVGKYLIQFRPSWLAHIPLINFLFARIVVEQPLTVQWGRQRVIDFLRADKQAALASLLDSTTESEVHLLPRLVASLSQPVYFIAGAKDRVMELKYVNHLASFHQLFAQNGDNVFEIAECGHLSMVEQPETVASIIIKVLERHQKEILT
ncbi:MAG: alpha/beta fold hydrolase [Xenococcaceae cyanobacterium]